MVYMDRVFEDQPNDPTHDEDLDARESGGAGAGLVCAACRHRITGQRDRIRVKDRHEHTFVNPGGFVYHIGCFGQAPGCVLVGTPSAELTWFAGYVWTVAHCRGCSRHLGWQFRSDSARFYGLVLDRLVEEAEDDGHND